MNFEKFKPVTPMLVSAHIDAKAQQGEKIDSFKRNLNKRFPFPIWGIYYKCL